MSRTILVIGESGSGKSTSLENLNHEETFIISIINKPLPFAGYNKKYIPVYKDEAGETKGNYYVCDDKDLIIRLLKTISKKRPEIKTIVIDDFQYFMTNLFMDKALEKGYDKFSELAKKTHELLQTLPDLRADIDCIVMAHSEQKDDGILKCKTIGKMTDTHCCIEGRFTYIFHAIAMDRKYFFVTNREGNMLAKSPKGMFDDLMIPNDLQIIKQRIKEYSDG
jgi:hypothetical protein